MTGGQGANTVSLAAARHQVLAEAGWDVEQRGLLGGPPVRVVANGERHATIDRALRLLGLGAGALEPVRPTPKERSTSATLAAGPRAGSPGGPDDRLPAGRQREQRRVRRFRRGDRRSS